MFQHFEMAEDEKQMKDLAPNLESVLLDVWLWKTFEPFRLRYRKLEYHRRLVRGLA